MLRNVLIALALLLALPARGEDRPTGEAQAAVAELGRLNGLALACKHPQVSARTKELMLAHVPKLRHWGEIYEQATTAAFVAPPGGCPEAAALRVETEVLASRLRLLLPASAQPAADPGPEAGIVPRYLLKGPNGTAVMDSDFRGRFQLIAFGYTYCPDICPTTLIEMASILRALGEDAKRLQAIFVSVDPERDSPEHLKTYVEFFDSRILGLTSSPEAVRRIADLFKVRYEKVQEPGASHYSVDHSAGMYLVGPDGVFIAKLAFGTPVDQLVERVRDYLKVAPASR